MRVARHELGLPGRGPAARAAGVPVPAAKRNPVFLQLLIEDMRPEKVRLLMENEAVHVLDGPRQERQVHELGVALVHPGDGRRRRVQGIRRAVEPANEGVEALYPVQALWHLLEHIDELDNLLRMEGLEPARRLSRRLRGQRGVVVHARRQPVALPEYFLVRALVPAVVGHVAHQRVVQPLREPNAPLAVNRRDARGGVDKGRLRHHDITAAVRMAGNLDVVVEVFRTQLPAARQWYKVWGRPRGCTAGCSSWSRVAGRRAPATTTRRLSRRAACCTRGAGGSTTSRRRARPIRPRTQPGAVRSRAPRSPCRRCSGLPPSGRQSCRWATPRDGRVSGRPARDCETTRAGGGL